MRLIWLCMLLLVVLTAGTAEAGYVDHSSTCIAATSGDAWVLTTNGQTFRISSSGWEQQNNTPLPMPVSQIRQWEVGVWFFIVDMSDNVWVLSPHGTGPWVNIGPPPNCGATNIQQSTWGQVKAHYR